MYVWVFVGGFTVCSAASASYWWLPLCYCHSDRLSDYCKSLCIYLMIDVVVILVLVVAVVVVMVYTVLPMYQNGPDQKGINVQYV